MAQAKPEHQKKTFWWDISGTHIEASLKLKAYFNGYDQTKQPDHYSATKMQELRDLKLLYKPRVKN